MNLKDELNCPVCTDLYSRPRECLACGRLFCSSCIAHVKSCPLCRKEPLLSRDNRFATRIVDNIRLHCRQCDALVARARLEEHRKTCASRLRKCSFKDCGFIAVTKEEELEHLKTVHMEQMWTNFDQLYQIMSTNTGAVITSINIFRSNSSFI